MTDGRNRRVDATKARIIGAGRALMMGGNFRPSLVEVARQGRVSMRSIFQHYDSLGKLHAVLLEDGDIRFAIYNRVMDAPAENDVGRIAHAAVFGRPHP